MADNKSVHIIGGGTIYHVRPHLAISSPAYGETARRIYALCDSYLSNLDRHLHLTKMAGGSNLETNKDIETLVDKLIADPAVKIVFFSPAMCDFEGFIELGQYDDNVMTPVVIGEGGKYGTRLKTHALSGTIPGYMMSLIPASKVIGKIRKKRKDILLVGFKTTCGATENEQYIAGLNLLKEASCNLVLANDVKTRLNMVITPEEARYHVTSNRHEALSGLVEMAKFRSQLTFTQSTVVDGKPVPWDSPEVPASLHTVVDYCITRGAYKPFRGSTVGHFAVKLSDTVFLTSMRKTNFNNLANTGLVRVETDGPDTVIAYGAKPSVGGQSQRIVFKDHPGTDCILHFHCPIKPGSEVPIISQREYECGSHQCGKNTSTGLKKFENLYAVFLDQHGPNIVFNKTIDPQEVIDFIETNFDLEGKTGGPVYLPTKVELTTREYFEKLLRTLHALNVSGRSDTPEYQTICEDMESPWNSMSDDDQTAMRALSAKLYEEEKINANSK